MPGAEPDSSGSTTPAAPELTRSEKELYELLHARAEPSGAEVQTARIAAEHLAESGFAVRTEVGGHGVVARLDRGRGPHVAVRAELDALPVVKPDGSTIFAHTCGHDLHLAAALSAARRLAEDASWQGTLSVLGQPAEENLSGALAMLEDGAYAADPPRVLLAQHCAPFPAGFVAHGRGPLLAAARVLAVTVHADGGHAGAAGASPLVTAAAVITRLQAMVTAETGPAEPVVVNVGALDGTGPANVIPTSISFEVWVRAMNTPAVDRICAAVERVVRGECLASGHIQEPSVQVLRSSPATSSDPTWGELARAAHRSRLGPGRVLAWVPAMATEDVGWFGPEGADVHGADTRLVYWMFGSCSPQDWAAVEGDAGARLAAQPPNHSPSFRPDVDRALPVAVAAMESAVASALTEG